MRTETHARRWFIWTAAVSILVSAALMGAASVFPAAAYDTALHPGDPPTEKSPGNLKEFADRETLARAVLAKRLNVSAQDVEFVREESVKWPDTSIGCPQPGFMYAKVIVPGYRLTFKHDGSNYEVHTADLSGPWKNIPAVSCEGGLSY